VLAPLRPSAASSREKIRAARFVIGAFAAMASLAIAALVACATTDTTTAILPITGIIVRAEALVSELGCGRGDGQVFKYAAVVTSNGAPVAGGVYDCFADAPFVNLPSGDGGLDFVVEVFAYNAATFGSLGGSIQDAFPSLPDLPNLEALRTLGATWTTSCTASQTSQIETLAVCPTLQRTALATPPGSIVLDTTGFGDGSGPLTCGSHYTHVSAVVAALVRDAGTADADGPTDDAALPDADAGPDAADAASNDAGAGTDDAGSDASPTGGNGSFDVDCPAEIRFAAPDGHYDIDVTLTGGFFLYGMTCHADVVAGAAARATCGVATVR